MSDAYHLVCHEEEKLVVIQTFSKIWHLNKISV
jgi:histidinol-phosphate/aromatic aminotransferase/cobyric acid decarboxylase-like protein